MADRDGNSMSHACSHLTLLRDIIFLNGTAVLLTRYGEVALGSRDFRTVAKKQFDLARTKKVNDGLVTWLDFH